MTNENKTSNYTISFNFAKKNQPEKEENIFLITFKIILE